MGLFDRLSRLARAELNHILDQATTSDPSTSDAYTEDPWREDRDASVRAATTSSSKPSQRALDFAALELTPGSDQVAIRAAYRRLLKRYHPDRFTDDPEREAAANELTRRLREAYERLMATAPTL